MRHEILFFVVPRWKSEARLIPQKMSEEERGSAVESLRSFSRPTGSIILHKNSVPLAACRLIDYCFLCMLVPADKNDEPTVNLWNQHAFIRAATNWELFDWSVFFSYWTSSQLLPPLYPLRFPVPFFLSAMLWLVIKKPMADRRQQESEAKSYHGRSYNNWWWKERDRPYWLRYFLRW